jgi:putative FmdB family regulatory protein
VPIYEYECLKCRKRFELRRRIADSDDNIRCPRCGAENPQRVISAFTTGPSKGACAPSSST